MKSTNAKTSLIYRLAIILASIVLVSCGGKQISGFKAVNKSIDTLVILPPAIGIRIFGENYGRKGTLLSDSAELGQISDTIELKINQLLGKKYKIDNSFISKSSSTLDSILIKECSDLVSILNKQKKTLNEIRIPVELKKLCFESNSDYFMGSLYYTNLLNYKPRTDGKPEFAFSVSLVSAHPEGSSAAPIYNSIASKVKFAYFVIDIKKDKIIFFDEENIKDFDPRDLNAVKLLVYKALNSLYYK